MGRLRIVVFVFLAACSGQDDSKELARGSEGGRCDEDGSCEPGLVCASDFCVVPPNNASWNGATNNVAPTNNAMVNNTTGNNTNTNNGGTNNTAGNNTTTNNGNNTTANSAPTCTITAPADQAAQPFTDTWELRAMATDPEDGGIPDAAIRWESDIGGSLGTGSELVNVVLSPSGQHTIRCIATDLDGLEGSDEVVVTVVSPLATISHPGGEDRSASEPMGIPFTGSAMDLEDGALTGASLVWTSNLEGEFGQGADFRAMLSVGQHTVTLTATDSEGNVGVDTLTFNVVP